MTKSRTLRIVVAVAVCAMVAGCSNSTASSAKKTYTMKDMTVGFIQTGSESGWRGANTSSFKETATADGITLKFYDSQNKIENQITAFNTFIQDSTVNVIVLAAVGTTGYDEVLKAAKAAGKVVIIEDRRIEADASLYYTYIGSDFNKEGHKSAAAMCDLLKGKATANIIELGGDQAASASIDRHKGFAEALPDCTTTKMTVLDYQNAPGWDPVQGKAIMEAFLKKYPGQIDGVFGHNDEQAIAGIQATEAAGLTAGTGGIVFVGVDATANGFKYLINGKLGADIECNPLLAPQVYKAALDALNGVTGQATWTPSEEGQFFAAQGAAALQAILDTRKY
ncbi:MAG TPA: substrate-binding domain-containing protein [Candidatus Limnocylindrales bacterium]|jgi:ABC-type sugar transport system substrate-binding protein